MPDQALDAKLKEKLKDLEQQPEHASACCVLAVPLIVASMQSP